MRIPEDVRNEIDALAALYELGDGAADALEAFVRLVDWGEQNFVPKPDSEDRTPSRRGRRSWSRAATKMLTESLAGLDLEPVRAARRLADIGTGAGFPGVVLAIALPQARVALVERVPEKCRFLRRVTTELGLNHVDVVERPVQEWSEGVGSCDVVTSRRAGRPNAIIERTAQLVRPGGAIVMWQRQWDSPKEALAADAAEAAGLRLSRVHRIGRRRLYLYEKAGAG
jgi:16S rRNA (guanine(527)-N(7))-methyltransferase RsmG